MGFSAVKCTAVQYRKTLTPPPLIDATLVGSVFIAVSCSPFERDALAVGHARRRLDGVDQVVRRVGCAEHLEARRGGRG